MGMTERDKKLLAIFCAVIVLGGYWFLVLGKKRSAVADAQKAVETAQLELDTAKAQAAAGEAAKKKYPVSYSRVLRMGKAIPVDSDYPSLFVQVNDIAQDASVNFKTLMIKDGQGNTATDSPTGTTGSITTCDVTAGGDAAAAAASSGATAATGTTGAPGATAETFVGEDKAKAEDAKAKSDERNAKVQANCSTAPTLTDVAAQTSGLSIYSYEFTFQGSFFNLYKVYNGLYDMVKVKNGRLNVTGRLLQINTINTEIKTFPDLEATVSMTGYSLPEGTTITAGATATSPAGVTATATGATGATGAAPAPASSTAPPAATIFGFGGK